MAESLEVRPFESAAEYERMIDYFLDAGEETLRAMGVDPARLPGRDEWLATVLADHEAPDYEKERLYLGWWVDGELVGHSSLSHIEPGEQAHVHLHLWRPGTRRRGLGTELVARSVDAAFERFRLRRVLCEPAAHNPAPQRTVRRLGFRHLETYRTRPTTHAFEQEVSRYEITREEWDARRQEGELR